MAKRYAAQAVGNPAAYEYKLAETKKRLDPDMRVLEFGCGTGTTALTHAPHVTSIKAIDYSEKMIEIARDKAANQNITNVDFQVSTLDTLTDPDGSYDGVLGMSILHLLPNRNEAIARFFRLLKPGGYFFSSTVCIGDSLPLAGYILPIIKFIGLAPYVGKLKADDLVAELKAAGFEIEMQWRAEPRSALFIIARKPTT